MLVPINVLSTLRERIYEAAGDTIEYGSYYGLERATGERVVHGKHHFAAIFAQGVKLPVAFKIRKRTLDQVDNDLTGIVVFVSGRKSLFEACNADCDGCLHARVVATLHDGAAAPRHEFGILFDVGNQGKHLCGTVWDKNGSLYGMH